MSIPVRSEYTPEKVAEARKRLEAELPRWERYTGDKFPGDIRAILDALTAVTAERDEAREAAEGHVLDAEATHARLMPKLKNAEADRDRLHKAITEALELTRPGASVPLGVSEARHIDRLMATANGILRAALDKEGNDDE